MIDGVGNVSSVLVVGADNPYCLAVVDRLVGPRLARVFLLDSNSRSLSLGSQRVREFGISNVKDVAYHAGDTAAQREIVADLFAGNDIDVVVIGPSPHYPGPVADSPTSSPMHETLVRSLLDSAFLAELCAEAIAQQGHGVVCMITHSSAKGIGLQADQNREYCASMVALNVVSPSIATTAASGGGRLVCAVIDPAKDPNSYSNPDNRKSTLSPLDAASEIAPLIVSRRKRRPYEVVRLPRNVRSAVGRIRRRR